MRIIFLTAFFSKVIENLHRNLTEDELVVIDFSDDNSLSDACRNIGVECFRFISWQILENFSPDLVVSYKLPRIIPLSVIEKSRYGGINIHPSLLPKHRGLNPWFHMYFEMDLDGGISIHKICKKPDSGNIIAQSRFKIEPGQPLPEVLQKAEVLASSLLLTVLRQRLYLNEGTVQETPEDAPVQHIDLKSVKNLPLLRLWHLLRGFPALLPVLYPELPHKFFEVGEYTLQSVTKAETESSYIFKNKCIVCREGIISLWDFSKIPTTNDYIDAVAHSDFCESRLKNLEFYLNADGSVSFVQGREAIIFPAKENGKKVGVRFLRNIPASQIDSYLGRLISIQRYLTSHSVTHFIEFEIIEKGVSLPKGDFPAILMKWYEGSSLMEFLRCNIYDKPKLRFLLKQFLSLFTLNHQLEIVHGDIHSQNINIDKNGSVNILDFDGIWFPALGRTQDTGGDRNWNHPCRISNKYLKRETDYFSEIIVCSTIFIALFAPDIFHGFSHENSLFMESDFHSYNNSLLMTALKDDPLCSPVHSLLSSLMEIRDLSYVPSVESIPLFHL